MVDTNLTEIVAILDRSGSMGPLVKDTIGGFNTFVEEQRKGAGKAYLTLVQFDDHYQVDYQGVDVNDVKPLDEATYKPRGSTALVDALGKTIVTVGERLAALSEEKRPGQVIFLVITDGEENSSREYIADKVREMVKHQTEAYNWSFVFLGGGDADLQKAQAANLGFMGQNSYNYSMGNVDSLYKSVSSGTTRSRSLRSKGVVLNATTDAFLNDDEAQSLVDGGCQVSADGSVPLIQPSPIIQSVTNGKVTIS